MLTYQVKQIIDGEPTFKTPLKDILAECRHGGAIQVLSPLEHHTARQRRWYKGICLAGLSDWNGETVDEWDLRLKAECNGNELLKKEDIYMGRYLPPVTRLTIVGVGKKNMTAFIENILSKATGVDEATGVCNDWPVTPPDPDLRKKT